MPATHLALDRRVPDPEPEGALAFLGNVLLVGEKQPEITLLRDTLSGAGVERIVTAHGGGAAIDALRRSNFDAVICDMGLSGMDAIEMLRLFSHLPRIPPVLVIASLEDHFMHSLSRMAEHYRLPVIGYLSQPIQAPDVIAQLRAMAGPGGTQQRKRSGVSPRFSYHELRDAIELGEIRPYFQAKHDTRTGAVVGVEALARWQHPDLGLLLPAAFLPEITRQGIGDLLFEHILDLSAALVRQCDQQGIRCEVAVNVDPGQLSDVGLADQVARACVEQGVHPSSMTIELTELHALERWGAAIDNALRLRMMHFSVALDDFGTGHSNLHQLRELPFDSVKIDRHLVHGAAQHATAAAVLRHMVALARALRLTVVAEGVERHDDLALLESFGVHQVQGYLLSVPVASTGLADLYRAKQPAAQRCGVTPLTRQ